MYLKIKSWDYLHIRADWADIQQPVFRTERELHKKKKKNQLRKLAKLKGCALFVALNSAQIDKSLPIKEKRETKFQGIREASFHPHTHIASSGGSQRRLLHPSWKRRVGTGRCGLPSTGNRSGQLDHT